MNKNFKKLKQIYADDPEVLAVINRKEKLQELADLDDKLGKKVDSVTKMEGPKGNPGHTPTDEELTALIIPLIPEPLAGHTPTDEELLSLIVPLIPEVKDGETPSDERLIALIRPLIPEPLPLPDFSWIEETIKGYDEKIKNLPEVKDVIDAIKQLKGNDRIDISSIRNWENLLKKASGNFDMNDQRWHGGGGSGTGSGDYTPQGVTTATVGGIIAGTDLGTSPVPVQDILDDMLYPPTGPTTTISTNPASGTYEIGNAQVSVDLSSILTVGSLPLTQFTYSKTGAGVVFTDNAPVSPEAYTDATGLTGLTNITYTATVTDGTFSDTATATFTFVPVYYYGVGAPGLNISADGGGLTKLLIGNTATVSQDFSPTVQVYYFAYPASYPALTSILDDNGFETISDWTVTTGNVTNSFGIVTSYRKYEFNNLTTQVNFTNTFKQ
jgi:hypothetical protein